MKSSCKQNKNPIKNNNVELGASMTSLFHPNHFTWQFLGSVPLSSDNNNICIKILIRPQRGGVPWSAPPKHHCHSQGVSALSSLHVSTCLQSPLMVCDKLWMWHYQHSTGIIHFTIANTGNIDFQSEMHIYLKRRVGYLKLQEIPLLTKILFEDFQNPFSALQTAEADQASKQFPCLINLVWPKVVSVKSWRWNGEESKWAEKQRSNT